ncbi:MULTISPECIES: hypothetical protein [unclassified Thiocapsa]|uniref:hypothetical protein n=1 Tax=unclassified Thiocapsa TaxID=2641286 RepID=UPI0035AE172B
MNIISHKIGSVISALVIGSVFFLAALQLSINQGYSEFVVGSLAWYAGNKFQDLVAWPVFIIFSFLGFSALSRISSHLQENYGGEVSANFDAQLVLWSLPFYAGAASLFFGGAIDHKTAIISALGITSLGVIGFCKRKFSHKSDPNFWSATLLVALLISLIPIELAVLLSRGPMGLIGDIKVKSFVVTSNVLIVLGFVFAILALTRLEERIAQHLSKLIFAAQIGLPLFFLTLYPARILQPSGEMVKYETTIYLKILVIALVAYGIYDVIKRFRLNFDGADWIRNFSPFALFGLIVSLKIGHTVTPRISPDDYHFGEHLLGWWSYLKGFVPYVDYVPAHGLLENYLRSILSYIFYDGTAASIGEAGRLAFALLGLFAFMSIYHFTGSLVLAFSVILLLGGRLTWFFFVPFICLWLIPSLRAQPGKWLSIWILTAPIVILGVPPQGLLLVAAFGLLAVKVAWDQIQFGDKKSWRRLGLVAVFMSLVFALTPMFSMLVGSIRYVMENGPINQIAYGIPWDISWNAEGKSGFVFEVIRMSWVAIPVLCLYVMHKNWRDLKDSRSFFYPALIFFSFSVLLIPYSMGRIDPGGVSRPGLVSIFGWAILFPLLMWGISNAKNRALVVLAAVFMSALLGFGVTSFSGISSIAEQKVHSPPLRDSAMAGLPNVGRAYIEESQWNRINRLNNLLKLRLSSDEIYLDLTSRNAHYFYLNRSPAMPVTAPYNLAPPTQQRRAVDTLKASPPKLALLQADNIVHDGGGLALRNQYLYRFVMDNYAPRMESGFIVGYLKSGARDENNTEITAEIKNLTDENWLNGLGRRDPAIVLSDPVLATMINVGDKVRLANGELRVIKKVSADGSAIWLDEGPLAPCDISSGNTIDVIVHRGVYREYTASLFHRAFAVSDFKKIPVAWGRSEKFLRAKMTSPISSGGLFPATFHVSSYNGSYKIEGDDPQLTFDFSALGVTGRNSGLLKFDFNCIEKASEPRMQIFWWGDERDGPFEASSVRFTAENGTLIVPLDASPWWAGLGHIKGLRFDLDNASACQVFSVENITLYRRE